MQKDKDTKWSTYEPVKVRWCPEVLLYLRVNVFRNAKGEPYSLNDSCIQFHEAYPKTKLAKTQLRGYELNTHIPRADMAAMLAFAYRVPIIVLFTEKKKAMTEDEVRDVLIEYGVIQEVN